MSEQDDILVYKSTARPTIAEVDRFILTHGGKFRDFGGTLEQLPLTHRFTPGLYIREIFMPAGAWVTTYIHKFQHPFVISQGRFVVYNELDDSSEEIAAPHTDITEPGTRRLLYIIEDTIWTTFHVTDLTDITEIEKHIAEQPAHIKQLVATIEAERIAG